MDLNEIYEQAEREDKLVAVVKYPYQKPEVIAIDKGLAPIQKTVGGHIDAVYLPGIDDVHGFCNDEGLFIGMEPNFYRPEYKDAIVGPAIFFGSGYDGGSESLSCEQVKKVTNFLTANNVKDYGEFYRNIKTDFACYKPRNPYPKCEEAPCGSLKIAMFSPFCGRSCRTIQSITKATSTLTKRFSRKQPKSLTLGTDTFFGCPALAVPIA